MAASSCHWPGAAAASYLLRDLHILDAGIPQRPGVCTERPQHRAAAAQRRRRLATKVYAAATGATAAAAAATTGATAATAAAAGVCTSRAAAGSAVQGGEARQGAGDGVAGGEGDVLEAVQAEQRSVQLLLVSKVRFVSSCASHQHVQ